MTDSKYVKNATADIPDSRDRYYQPSLAAVRKTLIYPKDLEILDQGSEGACTGFGLAAVINRLYQERKDETRVSARMLYEMAKRYDEWPGEAYSGSSCRGAIRGWKNMGVCTEQAWKYEDQEVGYVTAERAANARSQTLGAYYRLKHNIVDFHSAMNEVGVVYVSARVHDGWDTVSSDTGLIVPSSNLSGGHAFALVGYDELGFWVQNSWGKDWRRGGLGLWKYEDWAENLIDGWVIQLALPTPQIFDVRAAVQSASSATERSRRVDRQEIAGHFVHLDDGGYHDKGRYFSNSDDVSEITRKIQQTQKYDHVVLYAHGGLNSTKASAKRVRAMKQVWQDNRIYPIHFMYDTGLLEEAKDTSSFAVGSTSTMSSAPSADTS